MTSLGIIRALGAVAGAIALFMLAWGWAVRQRRRRIARAPGRAEPGFAGPEAAHRLELRLAALERAQSDLAARLEGAGGAEERLQATAGQLLGLVRDKNATIETALAGLDQLRNRMRVLEQIGDAAEARSLFERLGERLAALESAGAAAAAAPAAEIAEQLTRLHSQREAAVEAVLGRLAPVETRLSRLEGTAPAEAIARLEARLESLRDAQAAAQAQEDGASERLAALEAALAARDPAPALDALAGRMEALRERVGLLEAPGESPFAAVSEQLTRLYEQKDAVTEAVFARLGPVEARLEALGRKVSAADPAVARLADAVGEVRVAQAGLDGRLAALEAPGESPFAAVSEQLTRLYAQKDAATEAVFARLAPVEARLETLGREVSAADPAVERLAMAVEELRVAQAALGAGLGGRLAPLEAPEESPFAAVSEQLTRLYAQKDAATEAVLARLGPVEARLEALGREVSAADPAVERLADAVGEVRVAQAGVIGRLAALEEGPFAAVSEQLTRLYAQKDAATEAVLARLGEVEAQAALAAAAGARLDALEEAESPLAAISGQLQRLDAEKDAAVAAVLLRLAPVEERLAALGQAVTAGDPAVARLAQGIEEARAGQAAAAMRLGERLSALERAAGDARAEGRAAEDAARAEAQAIAEQLIALRMATAQTEIFADRLALLEASLPRLSTAQALMMQALERQAATTPPEAAAPETAPETASEAAPEAPAAAPETAPADPLEAFRDLPAVVSLHRR